MDWHQDWYLAHWRLAGQPAERKQSAIWRMHSATAILHVGLSENTGMGLEHHFPQPYSQVGKGVVVTMHLVLEVVVLEVIGEVVLEGFVVAEVIVDVEEVVGLLVGEVVEEEVEVVEVTEEVVDVLVEDACEVVDELVVVVISGVLDVVVEEVV